MSDPAGIDRQEFVKATVAIGGASALSACLDRGGVENSTEVADVSA